MKVDEQLLVADICISCSPRGVLLNPFIGVLQKGGDRMSTTETWIKLVNLVICIMLLALTHPCHASIIDASVHVVWPPNQEGGTFYLHSDKDPDTNRYTRKGYIEVLRPIQVMMTNGNYLDERFSEQQYGPRFQYVKFTSQSGACGWIKLNSIKPLPKLATHGELQLIDKTFRYIVIPIYPDRGGDVVLLNQEDRVSTVIHKFSRSSPDIVITDGVVQYISMSDVDQPYLKVKFFMKLEDGSYKITEGWLNYCDNGKLYELMDVLHKYDFSFSPKQGETYLEKIKNLWNYWINDYDDNKLERAMRKGCGSQVDITFKVKSEASFPLSIATLEGTADLAYKYHFPKGYRYSSESYLDPEHNVDLRILKTIKCKDDTSTDWYTQRLVCIYNSANLGRFQIFQDELIQRLGSYFETPLATGSLNKREDMVSLVSRGESNKDYYSAFYLLRKFIRDHVIEDINMPQCEKNRMCTFLTEQIVNYKQQE